MSTDYPGRKGEDEWRDCRPPTPEDGCDPSSSIDQRKCRDKGLTAQLEYTKEHGEALETAQTDYDKARSDYREKRHEAALKVQDMKHQVKHLIERIKCLIEQERVVRCLDDAFQQVCEQLDCCEDPLGCCVDEVEFDSEPPESYRKLVRRIDHYKEEVAKAKSCFEKLVAEPGKLTERVDAVKTALDAILAALADDASKVDLKKQYATALVVQRQLARIWNGFTDNAAYVDCLCRALTLWSNGVEAVSLLIGAKAVLECERQSAQDWCAKLTAEPVAEILVLYDRLCISDKPCGSYKPEEPEGEHPEDCGCGKHDQESSTPERTEAGATTASTV
jgi:hypothetical protein